ncbi:MAG: RagB/SusD family nutrient uptake outer membrane protein [Bacteroidota bacterium]
MKNLFIVLLAIFAFASCTDLEEELREDLSEAATPDPAAQLVASYDAMRGPYQDQALVWASQEHTSDECLGPTRGPDWDDNGVWRVLHNHTWDADHQFLANTFSQLLQVVFFTSDMLKNNPTPQQAAEARFLRAYVVWTVFDGWGQVPFRRDGTSLLEDAEVLTGEVAIDFILTELDEIMNDLPDGPTNKANKDAAKVLKMKVLLNRGMYLNRENPSFDSGDLNEVASLADQIIGSGKYSLATNYFDNFAPNNDQISTENIWTAENIGGSNSGNVRSRWYCTLHYNQNPSGWNGFATLGDFYASFDESDIRRGSEYEGMTEVSGVTAGFLAGQQFDAAGKALEDRKGNPLSFTPEVSLTERNDNLEVTGVRVIKYPIDYAGGDNANNDYVYYRYADVMLMKAEAALRTGDDATALDIVNQIRTIRGTDELSSINEDALLAERGRELYWEGHRRTDLLRFGKFLDAWEEKPASGSERLLFPIPAPSLASNPNLMQNPGYGN